MTGPWIIDQLVCQGVSHFCIAPGSRNTPLVLAAANHPKATAHVHFDERGLGFFALGLAQAKKEPVAMIVTSGTAVGNCLPAVMEAKNTHTPLLFITADRPFELRNTGANQTTDQVKIFQNFVSWACDLPAEADERAIRSQMAQAVFFTKEGPVQINCQFKEPFDLDAKIVQGKQIQVSTFSSQLTGAKKWEDFLNEQKRGAILIGKTDEDVLPIYELAKRLGWPIFADLLSNARKISSDHLIPFIDSIEPDCILHFGGSFISKKVLEWIDAQEEIPYLHISEKKELCDPLHRQTERIHISAAAFCQHVNPEKQEGWIAELKEQSRKIQNETAEHFAESRIFTESHAMKILSANAPPKWAYFLGNSMPVREADWFLFPKEPIGFFANRGVSGIDGNLATAAGIAENHPVIAFIGDQSALHDLNSLALIKKSRYPVLLILSNNFGGGIFSHLPIAKRTESFETYFAASHTTKFEHAAKLFDLPYFSATSDFQETLEKAIRLNCSALLEVFTDREANAQFHRNLREKILCTTCQ